MNKILLLSTFFLITMPFVSADLFNGLIGFWTFGNNYSSDYFVRDSTTPNLGDWEPKGNMTFENGALFFDNVDDYMTINDTEDGDFPPTTTTGSLGMNQNSTSICFMMKTTSGVRDGLFTLGNNDAGLSVGGYISNTDSGDPTKIRLYMDTGAGASDQPIMTGSYNINSGEWVYVCWVLDSTNKLLLWYYNSTNIANSSLANMNSYAPPTYSLFFGCLRNSNTTCVSGDYEYSGYLANLTIYNRTLTNSDVSELYSYRGNPTISELLYISNSTLDMISDGSCTSWRTNKATQCETTDGTPTVSFSTNKISNCSMSTVAHTYNSSIICGTTGSADHLCTLPSALKLSYGLNYLHLSCNGGGENDQSGAMTINMTAGTPSNVTGLVSCIKTIGSGCGVTVENNCAVIMT